MRITRLVELISGSTATILNVLLIPLIITKSSQRIGFYKYFLLAYTVNACYLTTSQFTGLPTWYIPENGFFFMTTVDFLPLWVQHIQLMSFVASYTFNTIILAWSFLYRLAIIDNPHPWIIRPRYFFLAFLVSLLLATFTISSCFTINPSPITNEIFGEVIYNMTEIRLENIFYIGGEMTVIHGVKEPHVNYGLATCLGSYSLLIGTAVVIYMICWTKISTKLRELRTIASATYRFQYRLFVLLTIQTILPIIFNSFPAFIVFVLSLAKVAGGEIILVCSMVVSFAQIVDPILTVLIVTDYKETCITLGRRVYYGTLGIQPSAISDYSSIVRRETVVNREATVMPPSDEELRQEIGHHQQVQIAINDS